MCWVKAEVKQKFVLKRPKRTQYESLPHAPHVVKGALGTFMSTLRDFEVELYGKQGAFVFTPGS